MLRQVMNNGRQVFRDGRIVTDCDCCGPGYETISGSCCGQYCDEMPRFLQLTVSGLTSCGERNPECPSAEEFNGVYILEWFEDCLWQYIEDFLPACSYYLKARFYMTGAATYAIQMVMMDGFSGIFNAFDTFTGTPDWTNCWKCTEFPITMESSIYCYPPDEWWRSAVWRSPSGTGVITPY